MQKAWRAYTAKRVVKNMQKELIMRTGIFMTKDQRIDYLIRRVQRKFREFMKKKKQGLAMAKVTR